MRELVGIFDGFGAVAACRGAGRSDRFQVGRKMRTASVRGRSDRKSAREMKKEARDEDEARRTFWRTMGFSPMALASVVSVGGGAACRGAGEAIGAG